MIKPTDEMIAAARDASIALTNHCSTYAETKASLEAALAIVERDYSAFKLCGEELTPVIRCNKLAGEAHGETHRSIAPGRSVVTW